MVIITVKFCRHTVSLHDVTNIGIRKSAAKCVGNVREFRDVWGVGEILVNFSLPGGWSLVIQGESCHVNNQDAGA